MNEAEPHPAELQLRKRAKQALRKQLRTVRAALPKSACEARSAKTMERLLGLEELRSATVVLAFASIGNEVSTSAFIDACLEGGKRVGLPRVVGDDLALHEIASGTELVPGAFSVPEPPETSRILSDDEIDFALIPALAVDPRGHRIGYGGGYYDRLLPRLGSATTCAVVYDFQLIAEVPDLRFDAKVELIVTDDRVLRAG